MLRPVLLLLLSLSLYLQANEPTRSKAKALKHVIYLHGAIIEQGDLKPTHPRFGVYDYPAILKALQVEGIKLYAEQRPKNTDPAKYAEKTIKQINGLIKQGIAAKNITLLGFSRGAGISIRVSSALKNQGLNYVIMANCGSWFEKSPELSKLQLTGHVFSLYEKTDFASSCQFLADRSSHLSSFKELEINTGKAHGAFFQPRPVWVTAVLKWILQTH